MVEEDGTKGFVASMDGWVGMSEEVVAEGVIHGGTSESVMDFWGESFCQSNAIAARVGKPQPGPGGQEMREFSGETVNRRGRAAVRARGFRKGGADKIEED